MQKFIKHLKSSRRRKVLMSIAVGIIGQLILLISGILSARMLGVEGRGHLAILVLFAMVISQIGTFGLTKSVTFYISKDTDLSQHIAKHLIRFFPFQIVILTVIHYFVIEIYVDIYSESNRAAAYLTLLFVPGNIAWQYGQAILQTEENLKKFFFFNIIYPLVYVIAILYIYINNYWSIQSVVLSWVLPSLGIGPPVVIPSLLGV